MSRTRMCFRIKHPINTKAPFDYYNFYGNVLLSSNAISKHFALVVSPVSMWFPCYLLIFFGFYIPPPKQISKERNNIEELYFFNFNFL